MTHSEYYGYVMMAISVLVIAFAILGAMYFVNKHEAKILADYQEKLSIEVNSVEYDRKRFAADLHDELGPTVAGISIKLQSLEPSSAEDEDIIAGCVLQLSIIQRQIREISNDLMPQLIATRGVIVALEEFIYSFRNRALNISFFADRELAIAARLDIHIYRIVLEIIHNCIKHSQAASLAISIYSRDRMLVIVASDDGIGYDFQASGAGESGNGLKNMGNRIGLINGTFEVKSTPGKGILIIIEIPNYTKL